MNVIEKYCEELIRCNQSYYRLDPEMRRVASEIAKKYPCTTEYVANILLAHEYDQEEAEKHIEWEMMRLF